jgi:hypothetical protein
MVRVSRGKKCMPCVVARIDIVGSLVVLERGVRVRRNCNIINVHPLLGHPVSENFVSWCQTLKNSSASFLYIQETYFISTKVIKKMCI